MEICNGTHRQSHDEICHDLINCPLCMALEENDSLTNEINSANEKIDELEGALDDIKDKHGEG